MDNLGFGPAAIREAHLQEWLRLMQMGRKPQPIAAPQPPQSQNLGFGAGMGAFGDSMKKIAGIMEKNRQAQLVAGGGYPVNGQLPVGLGGLSGI